MPHHRNGPLAPTLGDLIIIAAFSSLKRRPLLGHRLLQTIHGKDANLFEVHNTKIL
jgi:hypothetical protein